MTPWLALGAGILLTAGGLLGVWLQGVFYEGGFPTPATFGEVRLAFTGPTAVTTLGCLVVVGVLFSSRLTNSWSAKQRFIIYVCFGALVLVMCALCGHLATLRVADILN